MSVDVADVIDGASGVQGEDSVFLRPRRKGQTERLIQFTEDEYQEDTLETVRPKKKPTNRKQQIDLELEKEKLSLERERLQLERERLELERIKMQQQEKHGNNTQASIKLKLQPFDSKKDDILTFLSEFDAISKQMKWTDELKILQMRTLLTGEARSVAAKSSTTYEDLKHALIDRYGKRPHEYFSELLATKKENAETYRALMAKIDQRLDRCINGRDPVTCLRDEFFLRALPPAQAQWVRRNKGSSSIVEAAEDYITPLKHGDTFRKFQNSDQQQTPKASGAVKNDSSKDLSNVKCYACKEKGHYASKCPNKSKINLASSLSKVKSDGLIHVPGKVNDREISFVKDTGASMTLFREDLVDPSYILEGQKSTLFTAIGQPFEAKLAVVNVDTPYYSGYAQVGLVPGLMADALLGIDIIGRKSVNAVTRAQSRANVLQEQELRSSMEKSDVVPRALSSDSDSMVSDDNSGSEPGNEDLELAQESENEPGDVPGGEGQVIQLQDVSNINADVLSEMQWNDPSLKNCRDKAYKDKAETDGLTKAFFWENGILKRKWSLRDNVKQGTQIVLPERLRKAVIELAHQQPMAGHLGTEKTKERILSSFYWPGIFRYVSEYCSTCDVCQKVAKRSNIRAPMVTTPIISEPFSKISMDIVGPLSRTKKGNKYILTIIDQATCYPEAFALPSCDAERIADCLIELFSRVGIPRTILTDQGSNFTSQLLKHLYEFLKVKGITTSPYHPESNGKCERFNGVLKAMLKKLSTEKEMEWDTLLPYVLFAYREVPHEQTGFAPFELLYGWPVRGPVQILKGFLSGETEMNTSVIEHVVNMRDHLSEMFEIVKDNLERKKAKMKSWYDKSATERNFSAGDEVLVLLPSDSSKMTAQWKGPYRIVQRVNDVNYKVNVGGRRKVVTYHINLLRKYNRAVMYVGDVMDYEQDGTRCFTPEKEESVMDIVYDNNLTSSQKISLQELCKDFAGVFSSKPGKCVAVTHEIRTTCDKVISLKPYRIPVAKRQAVKQELDSMLEQGLIQPSKSAYSSPIVLVTKANGALRICVDYRKLNEITLSDAYPIPRISDVFEKIGHAKFFSRLDLTKGYYQVPLSDGTREKSAFVTPFGQYEFLVMPFGMKTAPATFIRLVDNILRELDNVIAYFDDIIIYTETLEDHIRVLRNVLLKLQEANLTVCPSKCTIGAKQLKCLGHIVGDGIIKPDSSKVDAMINFPLPLTKKQVKSFLGLTGYYRQYIKDYANMSAPLTDMLRKACPTNVDWSENAVRAFQSLKHALSTAPVLTAPDFGKAFILQTDASDKALGAVLSQEGPDGEHPVAYLSRKLLPREQNYSTIEKELLGIVWAIGSLSYYLDGRKFYVETDHNPLVWLNRVKDKNQRLLRWSLALQPYDFEIRYRRGSQNLNADSLSRC